MKDGLYVLPSAKASTVVSVADGIPKAESLAGGNPEDVRLKLEVLYPDRDFSKATVLNRAVPGAYDRAGFAKSLVKTLLSLPKDEMAERLDGFLYAWAEQSESFEVSFVMSAIASPFSYRNPDGTRTERLFEERNRLEDVLARTIMDLPGWERWREAHKANLVSNLEDAVLQRRWIADPNSVEGWTWTKDDAEDASAAAKANPDYAQYFLGNSLET